MSPREHLRALAEAMPPGSVLTVPREWIVELLASADQAGAAGEGLLTVAQAAARLQVKVGYLYRKAKKLPFAVKLSRKELRFDPVGLEAWLREPAQRRATSSAAASPGQ